MSINLSIVKITTWIDRSDYGNNYWVSNIKKIGGASEYHALFPCVGRECESIDIAPRRAPYEVVIEDPIIITRTGLEPLGSCQPPYCKYFKNVDPLCFNQKSCIRPNIFRCFDSDNRRISCATTEPLSNVFNVPHL